MMKKHEAEALFPFAEEDSPPTHISLPLESVGGLTE